MLVLSRKLEESIQIGENITLKVLRIRGGQVRIGIDAPPSIKIVRSEIEEQQFSRVADNSCRTEQKAGAGISASTTLQ